MAKKAAEKKFIDIAAAKEVLTDPGMCPRSVINKFITQTPVGTNTCLFLILKIEKRQKYDNGEDPLDPEAQQQQHGHHGFNPFQHGGFQHFQGGQFKFHFN